MERLRLVWLGKEKAASFLRLRLVYAGVIVGGCYAVLAGLVVGRCAEVKTSHTVKSGWFFWLINLRCQCNRQRVASIGRTMYAFLQIVF